MQVQLYQCKCTEPEVFHIPIWHDDECIVHEGVLSHTDCHRLCIRATLPWEDNHHVEPTVRKLPSQCVIIFIVSLWEK